VNLLMGMGLHPKGLANVKSLPKLHSSEEEGEKKKSLDNSNCQLLDNRPTPTSKTKRNYRFQPAITHTDQFSIGSPGERNIKRHSVSCVDGSISSAFNQEPVLPGLLTQEFTLTIHVFKQKSRVINGFFVISEGQYE